MGGSGPGEMNTEKEVVVANTWITQPNRANPIVQSFQLKRKCKHDRYGLRSGATHLSDPNQLVQGSFLTSVTKTWGIYVTQIYCIFSYY